MKGVWLLQIQIFPIRNPTFILFCRMLINMSEEIEIFGVFISVISLCNSRFCLKHTKLKIA